MFDKTMQNNYNIFTVGSYEFEWDPTKNSKNISKHGVSFFTAAKVFDDLAALVVFDTEHSVEEDRYILLGDSGNGILLLVSYCVRGADRIRIISARKATKNEEKSYRERNSGS